MVKQMSMVKEQMDAVNVGRIVRDVEKILKFNDIEYLSEQSYRYISIMGGFIAHCDIDGFMYYYQDIAKLLKDLERAMPAELSICKRDLLDVEGNYNGYGLAYAQSTYDTAVGIERLLPIYKDGVLLAKVAKERAADMQEFTRLKTKLNL